MLYVVAAVVMVVVVVVAVLRRTWQAAWEVELRGRLLRPFFFTFGCFVEARRPLLEKFRPQPCSSISTLVIYVVLETPPS